MDLTKVSKITSSLDKLSPEEVNYLIGYLTGLEKLSPVEAYYLTGYLTELADIHKQHQQKLINESTNDSQPHTLE